MKLIVGLGNPGQEYAGTRHNVGFRVTEELAQRHDVTFRKGSNARVAKIPGLGNGVLLAEPTTFMNLSGWAVQHLVSYYRIELPELLVVVDDADLPLGRLRARPGGSAGGHNGLKSIAARLGTDTFPRLRIGVGRDESAEDLREYVLGRFRLDEEEPVQAVVKRAADAAELFAIDGIVPVMNRFNAEEQSENGRHPDDGEA